MYLKASWPGEKHIIRKKVSRYLSSISGAKKKDIRVIRCQNYSIPNNSSKRQIRKETKDY